MIVRILAEGQFEVPDRVIAELNEFDAGLESAVASDDEAAFSKVLADLLEKVRACGTPLPDQMVVPSDAILPSSDSTIAQVRSLLGDDGLIPG